MKPTSEGVPTLLAIAANFGFTITATACPLCRSPLTRFQSEDATGRFCAGAFDADGANHVCAPLGATGPLRRSTKRS